MTRKKNGLRLAAAALGISALALTGCTSSASNDGDASGAPSGDASGAPITLGTTDKVTSLDPAGSYDNGSFMVMNQIFPFLLNSEPGSPEPSNDLAESAEFTSDKEFTVKLKPGLKWANGNDLDSKDVKFTFDRQLKIADPNGPSSLLGNVESITAPDATTVVFKLKVANDQTFPQVLTSPVGPIVDDEVFPADKVMADEEIVAGKAFGGQYVIDSYNKNSLISMSANDAYAGVLGAPANKSAAIKYYADSNNLKLDVQQGNIDVAYRSLTPTDVEDLGKDSNLVVHKGPGGELRYIVFNFDTMPYGAKTADADAAKSLAVRQAAANLIDREAIASEVYKGTYTPAYSYVPQGFTGAIEPLKELYGTDGKPDAAKAKKVLEDAGVDIPVSLPLQYNPDHYGPSSGDEYALVKKQLEADGLFKVDLKSTEWVTYQKQRVTDYPAYQLGWFPDYSDADNYLSPFFAKDNFLSNNYDNPAVDKLISEQRGMADAAERTKAIEDLQTMVAKDLSTLPLLQGAQVAVAGKDVQGVEKTLDPSFKFRLGVLSK
ncbi:ABC transporter substrate-binding protein [Glutamicibacter protophormiae]|uniref:Peptide/nickel transport system substrate-binding protein n=1 Tax=Glutamicibacter protophormiae TaxID=37930 RepID=A0ABS4XUF2_GLUPR|nr:ABC transporter substrate-binding protein [Glutamicibacter protophormiae]MBP2400141.1 peptide/nickel transport system substrate-binding protein [Glutamicibacter protophormiae]QRQ77467.1 peptide ABC transporter substrate-binding protein [Glutamicibacter protophormiae]GGL74930.1 peptide ABC transporter substrate-binding protein [Glutamicibacter protophormiae]